MSNLKTGDISYFSCKITGEENKSDNVDPVTAEIVRHSLNSAADQMKRALVRTAFSPVIYEVLDFASAIYDKHYRLLAQAPSLPLFMGTMNFCIEAAVKAVGGESNIYPGDIIIYNSPYGTGSHPQDCVLIMPVYAQNETIHIGYTAIKAHWLDCGGKEPYSTDTVDVFQEGTVYPGVKLYSKGKLVEDMWKMCIANTRVPKDVAGDINAQCIGIKVGAREFTRVVDRFGIEEFNRCVEKMFDAGEKLVRSYLQELPDGVYKGQGQMDNPGVGEDKTVPFEISVEVKGSDVLVDFSNSPIQQPGPINCPLPSTVSASRIALAMLAGGGEAPNEGYFRSIKVKTKIGTMFHPESPAPAFLYGWPALQAMEVFYRAISVAAPNKVPASSGGCILGCVWWGVREKTGEPWADGSPYPVGHGAFYNGDSHTMLHIAESATRFSPIEVLENRNPWIVEKMEFIKDSMGQGEYRGGCAVEFHFRVIEDCYVTTVVERTKLAPWGLKGGLEGMPNNAIIEYTDGKRVNVPKATRLFVPKGAKLEVIGGGGGGFGNPSKRNLELIKNDLLNEIISIETVKKHFPQYQNK